MTASSRGRSILVLSSMLLGLAACEPDPHALAWRFAFGAGVARDRVRRVRARILRGDCESSTVLYEADVSPEGSDSALPPQLGGADYAFSGVATDGACRVLATGCIVVSLPRAGSVDVPLHTVEPPRPLCAPAECTDGVCGPTRDASVDLGPPPDAPPPPDLGPPPDGGSPRIPIARVAKVFRVMDVNYFRVAFSARPGAVGEPSGALLEPAHFWAMPPPCGGDTIALVAAYVPEPTDPLHAFYGAGVAPPSGYREVPVFACVPRVPGPGTIDIVQLSMPGAPAAERYYTADPAEAAEIRASGYDDDGIAFRGWSGP